MAIADRPRTYDSHSTTLAPNLEMTVPYPPSVFPHLPNTSSRPLGPAIRNFGIYRTLIPSPQKEDTRRRLEEPLGIRLRQ